MNHFSYLTEQLASAQKPPMLVFFILSLLVIIFTSSHVNGQETTDDKLKQVKQAISKQKTNIKKVDSKRQKLVNQLKHDELEIAKASKALNTTNKSLTATQQTITKLAKEKKELTSEQKRQEDILAKQLRAAYSTGHHDYLKLLLNQEDSGKVQRTISYYQYLNKARIKEITNYQQTIEKIIDVTNEQQQQAQQLEQLQQQQQQQKLALEKSSRQRKQTVTELNQQLLNSKQQLEKLLAEEANLTEALERIARLSKQEVNLNGLGKLKRQLSWPVKGRISRSFGSRKQDYLKWKGVLLSAPIGREVKTIHNGTILFSDWLKGYGLVTVVDHGKGYMSLYGHNQALLKSVGDRVETGEPIALVGQSGGQSQPALYFEIRHNGQAVNPKLWCR
ncbi:non-catalytic member of peptidase subfamily M23B [Thalassotalea insulae]|uniref:Non-catalytic member of peptidase subfamily M23B n=1 Tax=Thalassotalea insulae TaxID=2056778 RepID=A0ABQ6GQK5_9GAMM|nr:peptidoglycan DD-metalloendopeptidase family protein [Thalassotalea insulae]GLX78176.1 non-catalytic member of peptidase subfamily M23B [Thalassotalea insulae]